MCATSVVSLALIKTIKYWSCRQGRQIRVTILPQTEMFDWSRNTDRNVMSKVMQQATYDGANRLFRQSSCINKVGPIDKSKHRHIHTIEKRGGKHTNSITTCVHKTEPFK